MTPGAAGGRSALVAATPRQKSTPVVVQQKTEIVPFSQYGAVATTTLGDSCAWIVGQDGGSGGLIDEGTMFLSTAGSTSTVITIYVNGSSIGTITYASSDTTPQTDALTPTRVVLNDVVRCVVTTVGTGAKGLSGFVPIKP